MSFLKTNSLPNSIIVLILIVPWLFFVFQGLFIPEGGYWIVGYQYFFSNPEISQNIYSSWLTGFLGALTSKLLGSFGWVGFKIGNVIIGYISIFIVYKLLIGHANRNILLLSLLAVSLFIHIDTYQYINYYSLTSLFFLISAFFLYSGLTEDHDKYIFIAGIFLGLNIFIRFPNLLGIFFIVLIIFYGYITKQKIERYFRQSFILLLGYFIAIVLVVSLMYTLGHLEIYFSSVKSMLSSSEGHGFYLLIQNFFRDQFFAFLYGSILFSIFFFLLVYIEYATKYLLVKKVNYILIPMGLIGLLFYLNHPQLTNHHFIHRSFYGLVYLSLLVVALKSISSNRKLSLLALLSFFIIELIPLGSNTRLTQAIYGLYLAVPLIFVYLWWLSKVTLGKFEVSKESVKQSAIEIIGSLLIYSLIVINFFHANGESRRWTMHYPIKCDSLQYIFVSKEKAATLNELIEQLNKYEKNYQYLLAYEMISTVFYLTTLKPFLVNLYPYFYTPEQLKSALNVSIETKSLPLVVRARTNVVQKDWPRVSIEVTDKTQYKKVHRQIMQSFLSSHNYIRVWHNKDFEILIPVSNN